MPDSPRDRITRRHVRASFRWPTAEECAHVATPSPEQCREFGPRLFVAARALAAAVARECDMGRQPCHVPVIEFLGIAREASQWSKAANPEDNAEEPIQQQGTS